MPIPTGIIKTRTTLTLKQLQEMFNRLLSRYGEFGAAAPYLQEELREVPPPFLREVVPMREVGPPVPKTLNIPLPEAQVKYFTQPESWVPLTPRSAALTKVLGMVPPGSPLEVAGGVGYWAEKQVALKPRTLVNALKKAVDRYPEVEGRTLAQLVLEGAQVWEEFVKGIGLQRDLFARAGGKTAEDFLNVYLSSKLRWAPPRSPLEKFVAGTIAAFPSPQVSKSPSPEEILAALSKFR